jgi:hypothetical protein
VLVLVLVLVLAPRRVLVLVTWVLVTWVLVLVPVECLRCLRVERLRVECLRCLRVERLRVERLRCLMPVPVLVLVTRVPVWAVRVPWMEDSTPAARAAAVLVTE